MSNNGILARISVFVSRFLPERFLEMRLLLTTIVIALLVQPVWAAEVYYCAMTGHASVKPNGIHEHTLERFKMALDDDQITFKGGKTFEEPMMYKIEYQTSRVLRAVYAHEYAVGKESVVAMASFENNSLAHSLVANEFSTSFHAECDKF